MLEWSKKHVKLSIFIASILVVIIIVIMPLFLNWIFYLKAPCSFFEVGYDISNVLDYYGAILTFLGTLSLGVVTIYQNYIAQKKTDKVNELTLELQKKSMAMAEHLYNKEQSSKLNEKLPKFELRNRVMNGHYMNLVAELKNVSSDIISGIKSISFKVYVDSSNIIITSDKVKCHEVSLLSGQATNIDFNNAELGQRKLKLSGQQEYKSLKNFTIEWEFQCEDIYSNTHYYRAKLHDIGDSNEFTDELWVVKKVG